MYLDVYIGDLDDPDFSWDGGDWNGNCPTKLSPFFPTPAPFREVKKMISEGKFEGKQVDWGGWVLKMNKEQILEFIKGYYDDSWYKSMEKYPHILKQMNELKECISGLDDKKQYALVASEL